MHPDRPSFASVGAAEHIPRHAVERHGNDRAFMTNTMITIQLNGQPHAAPSRCTVAELLQALGAVRHVAVEINEEVVPRARHAETALQEGDRVELVTLVGGG